MHLTGIHAVCADDSEIESVRLVLSRSVPFESYPFVKAGQRVQIRGGSLDGVEGVMVARNGDSKLVVSLELIQRSLAVTLEGYEILRNKSHLIKIPVPQREVFAGSEE